MGYAHLSGLRLGSASVLAPEQPHWSPPHVTTSSDRKYRGRT
jgi:hypothetical protein